MQNIFFIELNNDDYVFVSGLNKSIQKFNRFILSGITTSRVSLIAPSTNVVTAGNPAIEDIFVNKYQTIYQLNVKLELVLVIHLYLNLMKLHQY